MIFGQTTNSKSDYMCFQFIPTSSFTSNDLVSQSLHLSFAIEGKEAAVVCYRPHLYSHNKVIIIVLSCTDFSSNMPLRAMHENYKPICGADKSQVNEWLSEMALAGQREVVGHFLFTKRSWGVEIRQFNTPYLNTIEENEHRAIKDDWTWLCQGCCLLTNPLERPQALAMSNSPSPTLSCKAMLIRGNNNCSPFKALLTPYLARCWWFIVGVTLHSPVDGFTWRVTCSLCPQCAPW